MTISFRGCDKHSLDYDASGLVRLPLENCPTEILQSIADRHLLGSLEVDVSKIGKVLGLK